MSQSAKPHLFHCKNKQCWHQEFCDYGESPNQCPKCGSRVYTIIYDFRDRNDTPEDNPRWSDSLGVNPEQIPEFKKQFGDLMEFDKEGRCLVKNRHHKKQIMKARGYAELD